LKGEIYHKLKSDFNIAETKILKEIVGSSINRINTQLKLLKKNNQMQKFSKLQQASAMNYIFYQLILYRIDEILKQLTN
jgi:hypothetical protein